MSNRRRAARHDDPYRLTFDALDFSLSLPVHMLFVGLPIALLVRAARAPAFVDPQRRHG